MTNYQFSVSSSELQIEAGKLLLQVSPADDGRNIIQTLQDAGIGAENIGRRDAVGELEKIFHVAGNPFDFVNVFIGFDSKWHQPVRNQKRVRFSSGGETRVTLGTEVNYYFQGILFWTYGIRLADAYDIAKTWKFVSRHGKFNQHCRFFLDKGYREAPQVVQKAYHSQMQWDVKVDSYKKRNPKVG